MYFMKRVGVMIIVLLSAAVIQAQDSLWINGFVYDKKNKEILVAASVYYNKHPIGTITNLGGEFSIERIAEPDSIVISFLGYHSQKYQANRVPERIYLEPVDIDLSEVVVTPDNIYRLVDRIRLKYLEIWQNERITYKAGNNTSDRFKKYSFFYRQITKTDNTYNEFIESFFSGLNVSEGIKDLVLQEGRYAQIKSSDSLHTLCFTNFYSLSAAVGFFRAGLPVKEKDYKKLRNKFIQGNVQAIYDIAIEDRIKNNEGDEIMVLHFKPNKAVLEKKRIINEGKLYVRERDLAVVRCEGTMINFLSVINEKKYLNSASLKFRINYRDVATLPFPVIESINCTSDIDLIINKKNHKARITSTLFVVNQKFDNSAVKLKGDEALLKEINKMTYNPEFWKNNPIIKRTKIEEEVIKSFEGKNAFGTFTERAF
ncbi:hypothetical protein FACS1894145_2240 [Bacteroidia bacterium]|nr:hypothetical protein FACS1894145_2240 [Bacteroidia bacterium]